MTSVKNSDTNTMGSIERNILNEMNGLLNFVVHKLYKE